MSANVWIEKRPPRPHIKGMTPETDTLLPIETDSSPKPLTPAARAKIVAFAKQQHKATGVLMQIVTFVGGQIEDGMKLLPERHRARLDAAAARGLRASYDAAGHTHGGIGRYVASDRAHKALASLSGAIGGLGGLPTALAELPVATTVIFRAVQQIAASYGEDPTSPETRAQCVQVFGKGGSSETDDSVDTSFIGARLALSGSATYTLIQKVAPKFATVLGQKLASQTVPILGAAAGAGTNYTFARYYSEIAHVHFGLRQLARTYDVDEVSDAYTEALAALKSPLITAVGR